MKRSICLLAALMSLTIATSLKSAAAVTVVCSSGPTTAVAGNGTFETIYSCTIPANTPAANNQYYDMTVINTGPTTGQASGLSPTNGEASGIASGGYAVSGLSWSSAQTVKLAFYSGTNTTTGQGSTFTVEAIK